MKENKFNFKNIKSAFNSNLLRQFQDKKLCKKLNFIGHFSNDLIQVLIKTGSVKFDLKFNIYRFKIDIFPIWEEYHLARQLILFEIAKDYKT